MTKLALGSSILAILCALGVATVEADPAACVHTSFKTKLVADACAKGGQPAAKDAMKAFMKDKKIKSCNECHSKLAPNYELKADGLDQFTKAGGK